MIKFLKKLLADQEAQLADINTRAQNTQDPAEIPGLAAERTALEAKIAETRQKITEEEARSTTPVPGVYGSPSAPEGRDFDPLGTYGSVGRAPGDNGSDGSRGDPYATREYEEAFRNFFTRGIRIPDEFHDNRPGAVTRENQTMLVSDFSAVIPTHWLSAITERLNNVGKIWSRCTHTNVPAKMSVPIADLVPEATWVGEGSSETKKFGANKEIVFQAYGIECKIATSLLADTMTLDAFKAKFIELATKSVIRAAEIAVFKGDGNKKFTGIINEKRIPESHVIEMTEEELSDWKSWNEKFFAQLDDEYAEGSFYMARSTYYSKINGMTDLDGQPIARVTTGLSGEAEFNFIGCEICPVSDKAITSIAKAVAGDAIAVFGDLAQYCINTPLPMQADEWIDRDENTKKRRVLLGADGHTLDADAFYIIKLADTAADAGNDAE